MQTKLDEREELSAMIEKLNHHDRQKLSAFLTVIDVGSRLKQDIYRQKGARNNGFQGATNTCSNYPVHQESKNCLIVS